VNTFANARSIVAARELFTRIAKMLTRPMKFGFTEIGERALNRLLFGFRREWVDRFVNNTIRRTPESKRTFLCRQRTGRDTCDVELRAGVKYFFQFRSNDFRFIGKIVSHLIEPINVAIL
jgi:hypothetical protein